MVNSRWQVSYMQSFLVNILLPIVNSSQARPTKSSLHVARSPFPLPSNICSVANFLYFDTRYETGAVRQQLWQHYNHVAFTYPRENFPIQRECHGMEWELQWSLRVLHFAPIISS
jgi:hypothetical protein